MSAANATFTHYAGSDWETSVLELLPTPAGRGYVVGCLNVIGMETRGETIPTFRGRYSGTPWWNKRKHCHFRFSYSVSALVNQQLCFAHVDEQLRTYRSRDGGFYLGGMDGLSDATPAG